jgi:hypothetical protein
MLGPSKLRCREPQRSKHYSSAHSKDTMLSLQHDTQDQLVDHYCTRSTGVLLNLATLLVGVACADDHVSCIVSLERHLKVATVASPFCRLGSDSCNFLWFKKVQIDFRHRHTHRLGDFVCQEQRNRFAFSGATMGCGCGA